MIGKDFARKINGSEKMNLTINHRSQMAAVLNPKLWIRKLKVKKDEEDVVVEKEEGNVDVEEGAGDIVVEKDGNNTANEVDKIIQERATMIDIVNDVVSED